MEAAADKNLRCTVALTAGRGRGKSAALGLSLAAAIAYGCAPTSLNRARARCSVEIFAPLRLPRLAYERSRVRQVRQHLRDGAVAREPAHALRVCAQGVRRPRVQGARRLLARAGGTTDASHAMRPLRPRVVVRLASRRRSRAQSSNPELNKAVVRVNVFHQHRQTIQYIAPEDHHLLAQAAAARPRPPAASQT